MQTRQVPRRMARWMAGLAAALLLALPAAPAGAQATAQPSWLPPDLSQQERQEWKDGRPPGWSRGLKTGWGRKGCPPGLAKKGRCQPHAVARGSAAQQKTWLDALREAIERLGKWGRERKLSSAVLDAVLIGFEGAARHGVPIPTAEALVMASAERGLTPHGIEVITRALAYGAERNAAAANLDAFARQGLGAGAAPEAIALGLYRLAGEGAR